MKKKLLVVLIILALVAPLFAQATKEENQKSVETMFFTDSLGREVTLPKNITAVIPNGPLAQIVLYTLVPEKLSSWSRKPGDATLAFMPDYVKELPQTGQFYGMNSNINKEALIVNDAQVIVDIGEIKGNMVNDLDSLTDQTGINTVFIEATLEKMPSAYRILGKLFNKEDRAEELALYCEKVLHMAKKNKASITTSHTAYIAVSNDGLRTTLEGTIHNEVLSIIGIKNIAKVPKARGYGGALVSQEQIADWDPDFIFSDTSPSQLTNTSLWKSLRAYKDNHMYHIPQLPFNWFASPPSVNRILGILWIGNICYPELYDVDIRKEAKEFYKLFYHYDLTDEELDKILK